MLLKLCHRAEGGALGENLLSGGSLGREKILKERRRPGFDERRRNRRNALRKGLENRRAETLDGVEEAHQPIALRAIAICSLRDMFSSFTSGCTAAMRDALAAVLERLRSICPR